MADPLDAIPPPGNVSSEADESTAVALADIERARVEAELESLITDIDQRKTYAGKIFWLVIVWLSAVGLILLLHMYRCWNMHPLPDGVLIALVAGSTVSVVGILASVIAYVFRISGNATSSKPKNKPKA